MLWLLIMIPALITLFVGLWAWGQRSIHHEIKRLIKAERETLARLELEIAEEFPGLEKYWRNLE